MADSLGTQLDAKITQLMQTQSQHTAVLAQHTAALAQLTQTQAQHTAALAQLTQTLVGVTASLAQIQLALVPLNIAAMAATVSRVVMAAADARAMNAHDRRGEAFTVVVRDDGSAPPHWPAGFDRAMLHEGPVAVIDDILSDYGRANGAVAGSHILRRNQLARLIGTTAF